MKLPNTIGGLMTLAEEKFPSFPIHINKRQITATAVSHPNNFLLIRVLPDQYPFMVVLHDSKLKKTICGGSIVTPSYILTVAHCLEGTDLTKNQVRKTAALVAQCLSAYLWSRPLEVVGSNPYGCWAVVFSSLSQHKCM